MQEENQPPNQTINNEEQTAKPKKATTLKKTKSKPKRKKKSENSSRKRIPRPYPASSFQEALPIAESIHKYASGEKVRRLTLLKQLDKSPTSSATQMMITNSTKYGLTTGSFVAEWLELTELGAVASNPDTPARQKLDARFKLAIEHVAPFQRLYSEYKGKRLPTHDVLKDVLADGNFEMDKPNECVDLFVVNAKYLGLLQTIAGSETLIPIEQILDEVGHNIYEAEVLESEHPIVNAYASQIDLPKPSISKVDWSKICFVVSPIGNEGTETRRHADLFLSALIEPALREFDLEVIRADKIGSAEMITSQIIEYLLRSRLVVADLSFHNPNAFYEMAIRHACKLPIVQISRKQDRLPFDVNQVRTVVIDTTDIYTLVPKLETYKSEIATQVRASLTDVNITSNPISVFFPGFQVIIPKEK